MLRRALAERWRARSSVSLSLHTPMRRGTAPSCMYCLQMSSVEMIQHHDQSAFRQVVDLFFEGQAKKKRKKKKMQTSSSRVSDGHGTVELINTVLALQSVDVVLVTESNPWHDGVFVSSKSATNKQTNKQTKKKKKKGSVLCIPFKAR